LEFIEFALDDRTRSAFETLLRGLGFQEAGRHRSKNVSHWKQGDINLVLNSERVGFAHSFRITHGTGVCALALRVDDAAATVERAVALRDEPFRQPVGSGELDIPAVRGLGGSLVYFVDRKGELDRLWDVDFMPAKETPEHGIGLTAVDHVAQSMRYEEMLSWILFYGSLLDVQATSAQAVLDPGGIVQSQAVQTPNGSLRLALNGSQSSRTLSSRFISEAFGAGVQHIAFATRDIFGTVERLVASGIQLLPIPAYYYEDLSSRTDLPEEMIQTLKRLNILYDREGDGEFFQAYTGVLTEGGFFFEIVERRDYLGYGAVNAPVRLAAQTRLAPNLTMPRT
jgi:4-hydroxyphenylpyruvate dioxygenase